MANYKEALYAVRDECARSKQPTKRIMRIYDTVLRALGNDTQQVIAELEKLPTHRHDGQLLIARISYVAELQNTVLRIAKEEHRG